MYVNWVGATTGTSVFCYSTHKLLAHSLIHAIQIINLSGLDNYQNRLDATTHAFRRLRIARLRYTRIVKEGSEPVLAWKEETTDWEKDTVCHGQLGIKVVFKAVK